eukprot:3092216-Alexandrium_andersonii.AAC.1
MGGGASCSFLRLPGGRQPRGKVQETAGSATTHLLPPICPRLTQPGVGAGRVELHAGRRGADPQRALGRLLA